MAVLTFVSASGSPGVTTTVLALGANWPRPVVIVEADPTAGSSILAGYFRGAVEPTGGLVQLMVAHRDGRVADRLPEVLLRIPDTPAQVLPGVQTQAQAAGLDALWPELLAALRDLAETGTDVLVDAGRLGLARSPEPLILGADALFLVTGSSLRSVAAARAWTAVLTEHRSTGVGLVLVGAGRPYAGTEIGRALGLLVVGEVAWDASTAAVFADGEPLPRGYARSGFLRSVLATGEAVREFADADSRPAPRQLGVGGVR